LKPSCLTIWTLAAGLLHLSSAQAQTPADQLSVVLQTAASSLASENGEVQAAFNAGIIARGENLRDFPEPPDAALRYQVTALESAGENTNLIFSWFPKFRLGGAYTNEGSMNWISWMVFTTDSTGSHLAPVSNVLNVDSCDGCGVGLAMGLFKNTPVALMDQTNSNEDGGAAQQEIVAIQSWAGSTWSKPAAFKLSLHFALNPNPDFLSCSTPPCTDIKNLGYEVANSYYRTGKIPPLSSPLTVAEAAQYATTPRFSDVEDAGNANYAPLATDQLPIINGQTLPRNYEPAYQFAPDSILFPIRFRGSLIVGRIGHGTIGWRVDSSWHIGFWKFSDGELVPIGAMIFSLKPQPTVDSVSPIANWRPSVH
jgi:hypothetical protein